MSFESLFNEKPSHPYLMRLLWPVFTAVKQTAIQNCHHHFKLISCLVSACIRITLTAFGENSATACLIWQLGYFVGGGVGPVMVAPFIDSRFSGLTSKLMEDMTLNNSTSDIPYIYPSKFTTAYWLMAGMAVIVAFAQLAFYIYGRISGTNLIDYMQADHTKTKLREKLSFRSCSPLRPALAGLLIMCQCLLYGGCVTLNYTFSKIIFSYDRDGPGLSVFESSLMTSSYSISAVVGIVVFLVPTSFLHIKYVLQVR